MHISGMKPGRDEETQNRCLYAPLKIEAEAAPARQRSAVIGFSGIAHADVLPVARSRTLAAP